MSTFTSQRAVGNICCQQNIASCISNINKLTKVFTIPTCSVTIREQTMVISI